MAGSLSKPNALMDNLIGEKFGRLTVIGYVGLNSHRKSVWDCICDWGTHKQVIANNQKETPKKTLMKKHEVMERWSLMAPNAWRYYRRRVIIYSRVAPVILAIAILAAWLFYLLTTYPIF